MKIQLKVFKGDSASRACMMTAVEVGSKCDFVDLDLSAVSDALSDRYSLPPASTPTMDDNGFQLWESRAIMQYLAQHDDAVFPKDPMQRCRIQELLFFDAASFAPAVTQYIHPMVYQHLASLPGSLEALNAPFTRLEGLLGKTAYVAGHTFTIADIAIFATASMLELASFDLGQYPAVAKWYAAMGDKEQFKEVNAFFNEWKVATGKKVQDVLAADKEADALWNQVVVMSKAIFDAADRDGSGELDRQELRAATHKVFRLTMAQVFEQEQLAIPDNMRLQPSEMEALVDDILSSCDGNADDKVSFKELVRVAAELGFTKDALTLAMVDYPSSVGELARLFGEMQGTVAAALL